MAHSLSVQKRIRQNVKSRARNRWRKTDFRAAIRQYNETILHGTVEQAEQELRALYKKLDRVATTPTIHKNTADRYKSRLTARLNQKKGQVEAA